MRDVLLASAWDENCVPIIRGQEKEPSPPKGEIVSVRVVPMRGEIREEMSVPGLPPFLFSGGRFYLSPLPSTVQVSFSWLGRILNFLVAKIQGWKTPSKIRWL